MSDFLNISDLTLAYGRTVAVEKMNLAIAKGELVALLGPSGCGKTTTMRAIAGLLTPVAGSITIDGRDVTRLAPAKREVGLMFQSYALFPHLTLYDNVAFGLRLRRDPDLDAKVRAGLETVGLAKFATRMPADLSGGQQQRVALARSLVMQPKVLLLDEPLSNLDARLRLEMRVELQRVQQETGVTMVFVTHDQSEAMGLADRIVLMRGGAIEQIATPEEIYSAPRTTFAADFLGFETILPIEGENRSMAWRPSAVVLGEGPHEGTVRGVAFAGERREYVVESAIGMVKVDMPASDTVYRIGQPVRFDLPKDRAVIVENS
ncbi:ABC transporter ATP-binding protein [Oceaniglobus trochenteri]|uniref:ABC transporter ATP-binding protein n=1 Tax=Oceaniglobus trochenteri TaxID=2763260 RepID=UPI001CFFB2C1|nr:ABC transporter ATP-binding protein [Oceaniglobus trochenteri]